MNQGAISYLKLGFHMTFEIFTKKFSNYFKYHIFLMASMFSALLLFPVPIFSLANIRIARKAKENRDFSLSGAFERASEPKRYWTALLCLIISSFLLLGAIGLIALVTYLFIGLFIFIPDTIAAIVMICIVGAIGAIGSMLCSLFASFYIEPISYIIDEDGTRGTSQVFETSLKTMKKTGKGTLFIIDFLIGLIIGVFFSFILLMVGLLLYFFPHMDGSSIGAVFALVFFMIFAAFLLIFFYPILYMARTIAVVALFDDILDMTSLEGNQETYKEEKELTTDELLEEMFSA